MDDLRKRYPSTTRKGHPLATKTGTVRLHRLALYDKIGPGSHSCHICSKLVTWGIDLWVDHLDWDIHNNAPDNLAPSCPSCNSRRVRHPGPRRRKLDPEKVRRIREFDEPQEVLAREFGVAQCLISRVRRGVAWTSVPTTPSGL